VLDGIPADSIMMVCHGAEIAILGYIDELNASFADSQL
jgi:hypothetical protein